LECVSFTYHTLEGGDKEAMMKRVNFTISEVEVKRLKVLTKKSGLSASEILRRAIDEYWERFETKGRGKA